MKRLFFISWSVLVSLVIFSSCNKYEEGPAFTILSATKRITGTWELKETLVNDTIVNLNDFTSMLGDIDLDSLSGGIPIDPSTLTITDIKATFEKDGDGNFYFALSMMGFPINRTEYMTWQFDEDKMNVEITLMNELQAMEILRLTNKEMWLRNIETEDGVTTTIIMKMEKEKE